MNILYCGDDYIEEGLLISILSLLNNVDEPLGIYILTMQLKTAEKVYQPVSDTAAAFLSPFRWRTERHLPPRPTTGTSASSAASRFSARAASLSR